MGSKVIRNVTKIRKVSTNTLAGRVTSGTGPAEELTATQARSLLSVYTTTQVDSALAGKVDSSSLSESIDDRVAALLVAGTNITITYNDAAGTLTVASTAGGLSGTGSVDNAALRADGTGGGTLQSSNLEIADLLTTSPNNTVNVVCIGPVGGTTNVDIVLKPKGTGAICRHVPDGTSTGGNKRGAGADDNQTVRSSASQVASGVNSFLFPSTNSTASGESSAAGGYQSTASGFGSWAYGQLASATQLYAAAWGSTTVSGVAGFGTGLRGTLSGRAAFCTGTDPNAYLMNSVVVGTYYFASNGDAQSTLCFPMSCSTTNATTTELLSKESFGPTTSKALIPANTAWAFEITVIARKQSGGDHAMFTRRGLIYRNATVGTTAIEGSVQTVGTDIASAGAAGWSVTLTADTTNGALKVEFTGQAATNIRTVASLAMVEVGYP